MRKPAAAIAAVLLCAGAAHASVFGFIDTSYNWNLNGASPYIVTSPLRSYDAEVGTFTINNAHLDIVGALRGESTYKIEIDAGSDASFNSEASNPATTPPADPLRFIDLQEAYIDVKSDDRSFGARVGKFATFMGVELIESPQNPVYSRGLLYNNCMPLTHTGAVVQYTGLDDVLSVNLGLVNGWDVVVDNDRLATVVGNVKGETSDALALSFTYMSGVEAPATGGRRELVDFVAEVKAGRTATIYLELNGGYENTGGVNQEWNGFGLFADVEVTDTVSIGFRYEKLDDPDQNRITLGTATEFANITIAPRVKINDTTTLRLELRIDEADDTIFPDDTGAANQEDKQTTVALQMWTTF